MFGQEHCPNIAKNVCACGRLMILILPPPPQICEESMDHHRKSTCCLSLGSSLYLLLFLLSFFHSCFPVVPFNVVYMFLMVSFPFQNKVDCELIHQYEWVKCETLLKRLVITLVSDFYLNCVFLKIWWLGTSLVVQRLTLGLLVQWVWLPPPARDLRSHMPLGHKNQNITEAIL